MNASFSPPHGSVEGLVQESANEFKVATACYREPDIFRREMDAIFSRGWVFMAHESEVAAPGDFKSCWIGRQPVILTRDDNGELNAFFNACPHRGATLCRAENGNVRAFVCPYHAWTFKTSGELVGIADRGRYPDDFPVGDKSLHRIARLVNYRGLIFGALSEDAPDFENYIGVAAKHVDLWLGRALGGKYRAGMPHRYLYRGNWKFQCENVLDGYHANPVHGSAYRTIRQFPQRFPGADTSRAITGVRKLGEARGYANGHGMLGAGAALEAGNVPDDVKQRYRDALVERNGEDIAQEILNNRHLLVFPNVCIMDNNIRVIQPIAHDLTEIYSYPMFLEDAEPEINAARLGDVQARVGTAGVVNLDDIEIFNANQTALGAPGLEFVTLSRGLGKEDVRNDGERIGHHSDETPQRAFWRAWQERMSAAEQN
jgi:phenylpropionate dioxygenase-like ring-hydroxylating dioxygenase large terminal subunit